MKIRSADYNSVKPNILGEATIGPQYMGKHCHAGVYCGGPRAAETPAPANGPPPVPIFAPIQLTARAVAAVQNELATIARAPLQPRPTIDGMRITNWAGESWHEHQTYIFKNAAGQQIAWLCPHIARGHVWMAAHGPDDCGQFAAAFIECRIQRLHTDLAMRGPRAAEWADDDPGELVESGYVGDDALALCIAEWETVWGETPYRWESNPWIWRITFRLLSRETDNAQRNPARRAASGRGPGAAKWPAGHYIAPHSGGPKVSALELDDE